MFNLFKKNPRIKASEISDETFKGLLAAQRSVVVTCMTGWCGACKMQKPLLHDVADHHKEDDIDIALVNIDHETFVRDTFEVRSIPTTLGFKKGILVFRKSGIMTRRELEDLVSFILNDEIATENSKGE